MVLAYGIRPDRIVGGPSWIHWYPDETVAVTGLPTSQTNGDPSFLTAVRDQLGLKVTPQDSPSEVLVIEGAEWPTPNPR
jgi:uncharacterized protein (TIGR03435 family)